MQERAVEIKRGGGEDALAVVRGYVSGIHRVLVVGVGAFLFLRLCNYCRSVVVPVLNSAWHVGLGFKARSTPCLGPKAIEINAGTNAESFVP